MTSNKIKGYSCSILSALLFGLVPFLTVSLDASGVSTTMLILLRAVFMIPTFALLSFAAGTRRFSTPGRDIIRIALHAFLGAVLTPLWLFASYMRIDTGIATSVHFSYPMFVLIGGILFFREKLTGKAVMCFVLCLVGIAMFFTSGTGITIAGIALALASGVAYASYALFLDHSKILDHMSIYLYTFYFYIFTALFALPVTLFSGTATLSFPPKIWLLILVTSFLSCGVAAVFFQVGVKEIGSARTSLLSTLEPITSIVMGMVFLSEPVSIRKILGSLLILFAVIQIIRIDAKEQPSPQNQH